MRYQKDEANPTLLFSTTWTEILLRVAKGEISAQGLAKVELCKRGVGTEGKWVGIDEAAKQWRIPL